MVLLSLYLLMWRRDPLEVKEGTSTMKSYMPIFLNEAAELKSKVVARRHCERVSHKDVALRC